MIETLREFIKPREIIISVAIVAVMIAIGFLIHGAIEESSAASVEPYTKAYKPTNAEQFQYGARTDIGSTLASGTITADEPVSTEHAEGEFLVLRVDKEHYTMHQTWVTDYDSDGEPSGGHWEYYWTWDLVHRDESASETYTFLGVSGKTSELSVRTHHVATDRQLFSDDRWVVYGVYPEIEATLFVDLRDNVIKPVSGKHVEFYTGKTVEETMESIRSSAKTGPTVFTVCWVILTIIVLAGFFFLDNKWLDGQLKVALPRLRRKS